MFAAHVKPFACWGRFFLTGEIWPGFLSSVLVGVDNLGTAVYSIAWQSFPWTTSWGGWCGGSLGARGAFPVVDLQAEKRRRRRMNSEETYIPAYSGDVVVRKNTGLLGPPVLGR